MELKLTVGFNTAKVKSIKCSSVYLELHGTIMCCQTLIHQLFKKAISVYTAKYNDPIFPAKGYYVLQFLFVNI